MNMKTKKTICIEFEVESDIDMTNGNFLYRLTHSALPKSEITLINKDEEDLDNTLENLRYRKLKKEKNDLKAIVKNVTKLVKNISEMKTLLKK